MKLFYFLPLYMLLLSSSTLFAQTYVMDVVDGTTVTTCSGTFTDSDDGSFNDYANNEDYTVTFCSGTSTALAFDFGNIELLAGDTLFVYAGTTTSGPLIMALNNDDDISFNDLKLNTQDSCVTFRFISNGSGTDNGWSATISCDNGPVGCNGNPAAADLFYYATFICNLDGYCGNTSTYYGEDNPGSFQGGGSCPTLFGGTIQNNSWLQFEASSTTIDLDFTVSGCADGIQVAILEYDGVANFTRLSNCAQSDGNNNGTFTVSASSLTVGNTYYIMIDGNQGSNCDYEINVDAAQVATVNAGTDQVICNGSSATLTASGPSGATYSWTEVGGGSGPFSGSSISVTPGTTTSYVVEVTGGGTCENQTDTVEVTVNACASCSVDGITAGTQTACNAGTNTYTQEVTVTYTNPPASGTLDVNGQSFAITTSPQTVILTNLSADGNPVDVIAAFSADGACTATVNSLFTAPASCSGAPCTPDNGTWD
jgi:hypothetical protein